MGKRRRVSSEDERPKRQKTFRNNHVSRSAPRNAPARPKAMDGYTTRSAGDQQRLVESTMTQNQMSRYNANVGFDGQFYGGHSACPVGYQNPQQIQQAMLAYPQQVIFNGQFPAFSQMPLQQQYTQPNTPRQGPQMPRAPQQKSPKRKRGLEQNMSQVLKRTKFNSPDAASPQSQGQRLAKHPSPLMSSLTTASIPASRARKSNGASLDAKPRLLSTLTSTPVPLPCAKTTTIIPNGTALPLLVEYAHLLFQKNAGGFGKVFSHLTEVEQQSIIRKTEDEGIRGFVELVNKYGIWKTILSSHPGEDTRTLERNATSFSANLGALIPGERIPITLPPQFKSNSGLAFIAMLEAVHNARPEGKFQCCKCLGWGQHGKSNCPIMTNKEDPNMSAIDTWVSSNVIKDNKFDQFLQHQIASSPTTCGFAHIRADGRIRTNWATPHIPLKLGLENASFFVINGHHYYAEGKVDARPTNEPGQKFENTVPVSMYQVVVPKHLRFESVQVSTHLSWDVRGPLLLMDIRRESRKLLVDRPEQLVDPLWEICLESLDVISSSWQAFQGSGPNSFRKRYQDAMRQAIHIADIFLANLLFYKVDAEKLLNLMKSFEEQRDDESKQRTNMFVSARTNDNAKTADADAELPPRSAIPSSANNNAQKVGKVKRVDGDLWSGTTEFGHFEIIKQILETRLALYAGFEAFMGTLGQHLAEWFLDDYLSCIEMVRKTLAKEYFPGLARLFACQLHPFARRGSFCAPRYTIAYLPHHNACCQDCKPKMAWCDNGRAEPTKLAMLDHFLTTPEIFQHSFVTTDMHDFGYIHDQLLIWRNDFQSAVARLRMEKQRYKDTNDDKQREVIQALWKQSVNPQTADERAKIKAFVDEARLGANHCKTKALTFENQCQDEAEIFVTTEVLPHPYVEHDSSPADFMSEAASASWLADFPTDRMVEQRAKALRVLNDRTIYQRMVDAKAKELIKDETFQQKLDQNKARTKQLLQQSYQHRHSMSSRLAAVNAQRDQSKAVLSAPQQSNRRSRLTNVVSAPTSPQQDAALVSSTPRYTAEQQNVSVLGPWKQSAPAVISLAGAKRLEAGKQIDELAPRMITDLNAPYSARNSVEILKPLPSTTAPIDVVKFPIDVNGKFENGKTALDRSEAISDPSTTLRLTTEPMEVTPRQFPINSVVTRSIHAAGKGFATVVIPSKELDPANLSRAALLKAKLQARRAPKQWAMQSEQPSILSPVQSKLGSKRGREDESSERPIDKRPCTGFGGVPATVLNSKTAFVVGDGAGKTKSRSPRQTVHEKTAIKKAKKLSTTPLKRASKRSREDEDDDAEHPNIKRRRTATGCMPVNSISSQATRAMEGTKLPEYPHSGSFKPPRPLVVTPTDSNQASTAPHGSAALSSLRRGSIHQDVEIASSPVSGMNSLDSSDASSRIPVPLASTVETAEVVPSKWRQDTNDLDKPGQAPLTKVHASPSKQNVARNVLVTRAVDFVEELGKYPLLVLTVPVTKPCSYLPVEDVIFDGVLYSHLDMAEVDEVF